MEQNKLAGVTCHSEATLLGHLCLKTCSFLSYNLLFSQMPSPPTPGLCILGACPVVRARVPSAFAGLANCPGISFFLPKPFGDLPKLLLSWRRWPCQSKATLRPAVSEDVKSDTRWLSPARISVPPPSTQPSILRPYTLLGIIEGLDFFPSSLFFGS